MTVKRPDHVVPFHREEYLSDVAEAWLSADRCYNSRKFNIVEFAEKTLLHHLRKGPFTIVFLPAGSAEGPAYVTFASPTLHIDRGIWEAARQGDTESEFIVAHEVAHLVLHDHSAQAFSDGAVENIFSFPKERSAEWQANTLAGFLLDQRKPVPNHQQKGSANLSIDGPTPTRSDWSATSCTGDPCPNCGSFSVHVSPSGSKCEECKYQLLQNVGAGDNLDNYIL